jgi:hypothetical protein
MGLDVRAREETHVQRLPEPEQETIDQICQAHGVSRINRFWWIVGRANDAGTVIHPSSAQRFPGRRDVLKSLASDDVIYFFPGCDADDDAIEFGLSDRGFDLCEGIRESEGDVNA